MDHTLKAIDFSVHVEKITLEEEIELHHWEDQKKANVDRVANKFVGLQGGRMLKNFLPVGLYPLWEIELKPSAESKGEDDA